MSISGAIKKELERMWTDLGKFVGDYSLVDAGVHPDTIRRRDGRRRRSGGGDPPEETLPITAMLIGAILIAAVLAVVVFVFAVI